MEDNLDLLETIKLTLKFNDYEVITATNGENAIKTLSKLDKIPDLIVSDIMMPKMDGYDFFRIVSEDPKWNRIPFIFLTAVSAPDDVRFGKMLGVDDYITKPFDEDDLLASIAGKIARNRRTHSINDKIEHLFKSLKIDTLPSIAQQEKSSVLLLFMGWDDKLGPTIEAFYPPETQFSLPNETIGFQLFNGVASIYGHSRIQDAQGLLLTIENIQREGYLYFDSVRDETARGGNRPIMLGVIAPRINYFVSLKIKELFKELIPKIKQNVDWDPKEYWEKISEFLSEPLL